MKRIGRYLAACLIGFLGPHPGGAGAQAREIDACGFLDPKEIAALLKMEVEPGHRDDSGEAASGDDMSPGPYSSTCLWRVAVEGPPPAGPSYIILNVMQWPAGSGGGRHFLQSFRDAAQAGDIDRQPIPVTIAEEGLWWGDGIAVSKGDRGFGISAHLAGARDREEAIEEALARQIARRL